MQQKPMEIPTGRLLSSPRFVLLLCLIPFLGHLPELIGLVDTNPLLFVSDMPLHRNRACSAVGRSSTAMLA